MAEILGATIQGTLSVDDPWNSCPKASYMQYHNSIYLKKKGLNK